MEGDWFKEHLKSVNKSIRPGSLHTRALRELPYFIVRQFSYLWKVPEIGKSYNYCVSLPEGQGMVSGELQAGQPHLDSWEGDGATYPRKCFHIQEGQEGDLE